MLEPAIKYKEQLEKLQYDMWFNDRYKYWVNDVFHDTMTIDTNTWNRHQFVSIHNNEVIGYIAYNVVRAESKVNALSIINFSNNKLVFGKDLMKALKDIFEKYKFRKLSFYVVVGNPVEKSYDKMIKKFGGRIVGICKDDVKLIDGTYHDRKLYEILSNEYFNATK